MSLIHVSSSSIRAVDFDGYHLFVQFHTSTTIYTHYGVPHQIYAGLMRAGSKGWYYNNFIRGKYK